MLLAILASCKGNTEKPDASGTFEADEILISSEGNGALKLWNVQEGQTIQAGTTVGLIDTIPLYLKKKQLVSQIGAVLSKRPDIKSQIAVLQEQLQVAQREKIRIGNLVKADAATSKQLDDINAQVELIQRQIHAQEVALNTTSNGIAEEANPILIQIEQLNDQLRRCHVINPIQGTVLANYVHPFELVGNGKALYKIADMSSMILRAYITGDQFGKIKIGDQIQVSTDDGKKGLRNYTGQVEWISDKAEFTPKTIQTKEERANLVYAVKIRIKNDGFLKIGMYGEIRF